MKSGFIYFMANKPRGTIYLGVTSDLSKRTFDHKNKVDSTSFSAKYGTSSLVYYEQYDDIQTAIQREKQLKNWKREWKIELIEKMNPHWHDLYDSVIA